MFFIFKKAFFSITRENIFKYFNIPRHVSYFGILNLKSIFSVLTYEKSFGVFS